MFKRKSAPATKPLNHLMLVVSDYVRSSEDGPIDTVVGTDLNGRKFSVILSTTGDAAEKENRNDIASFAKEKSNHHVPAGGLMLLNTVWVREPKEEGQPHTGIARWAEFFAHQQSEMVIANAMFFAGTTPAREGGQEKNWAIVDRLGSAAALDVDKVPGYLTGLGDRCAADSSRAKPLVRLVSEKGEILGYTSIKQDYVDDGKGGKRIQTGEEMAAAAMESKGLKALLEKAEQGAGTLEIIPIMSVRMSPKMMSTGRGKNFLALAKKFSNDSEIFACECYIRRAPTDEYNFISHFAATDKPRFDPVCVPSAKFQELTYSESLLREMGIDPASVAKKTAPAEEAPAIDENMSHEPTPDELEEAPGFSS